MLKQLVFCTTLVISFGILAYTFYNIFSFFRLTKPYPVKNIGKRFILMMKVAIRPIKNIQETRYWVSSCTCFLGVLHYPFRFSGNDD